MRIVLLICESCKNYNIYFAMALINIIGNVKCLMENALIIFGNIQ